MACAISCMISVVFVIAMIYFYNKTENNEVVQHYQKTLPTDLQIRYARIVEERKRISYEGYALGGVLSLGILFYNEQIKKTKMGTTPLVCTVVATSFLTNYFYYILHPKTDWMLNHMQNKQEVHAWLLMYREMQVSFHTGLVVGIVAIGVLAFAFRC
jgi:uncharacterized membrane protein YkgB